MADPVEAYLSAIEASLRTHPNLLIVADPGAGKTTHVPRHLMETNPDKAIWVLEPRRLAARMAACYVASKLGEEVGQRVGYRVRLDDCTSAKTRLIYMTEGTLLRALLADVRLANVGAVIFDEFHNRSLASDTALAVLRHVQQTQRPDLRLLVMSATLDVAPVSDVLGKAKVIHVPGRTFPIDIQHASHRDKRPLDLQVASAVSQLLGADAGNILVFLPGVGEIRRAGERLATIAAQRGAEVMSLHGSMFLAEQDRVLRRSSARSIILATNVAETSVTVPGITAVVDCGLARLATYQAWTGVTGLQVQTISQSAAIQRAGRAGRTQPGLCVRLFTLQDFRSRPFAEVPEIMRLDVCETLLLCHLLGLPEVPTLPWLDPPPAASIAAAQLLLQRLGALDQENQVTPMGRAMADLPVHPRLARLVLAGRQHGVGRLACDVAAWLSGSAASARTQEARRVGHTDLDQLREDLDSAGQQVARKLARAVQVHNDTAADPDRALSLAVLAAYPDRVARRIDVANHNHLELLMCGGGRAQLAKQSVVRDAEYLVALEAQERREGTRLRTWVHVACAIAVEDLLDIPGGVEELSEVSWNESQERVETHHQLRYGALVLSDSRSLDIAPRDAEQATRLFVAAVRNRGIENLVDMKPLRALQWRLRTAAPFDPKLRQAMADPASWDAATWLEQVCSELHAFSQLRDLDLLARLQSTLPAGVLPAVARLCPESVVLASGRRLPVHYESDRPPWVESYLQDFFGQDQGPKLAGGQLPITLHLLAPNRRPVQVTHDLAGFWQRHYPSLRQALSRRYPRHAWPEDPRHAEPPPPRRRC